MSTRQVSEKSFDKIESFLLASDLTTAQRVRLLYAALDLCDTCRGEFDKYCWLSGRDFVRQAKDVFWKWFGVWPHAMGCPKIVPVPAGEKTGENEPEEADDGQEPARAEVPAGAP